ncbi:uncharacterized protein LOC119177951 [Rhipicephalus microplus]|uniref:uncharacterized protein LOC119177951 n=1 Tax=Rhipicephalus microplus TaxID=6941 RepID=UPI003F6AB23A
MPWETTLSQVPVAPPGSTWTSSITSATPPYISASGQPCHFSGHGSNATMRLTNIFRLCLLQENAAPNLRPVHQLTGPPLIFSLKYVQTAPGALNLTETCLSMVLYKTLCSHAEETLSAALFTFSFAYSIAGLYMLLNGIFNTPSSDMPSHPSAFMVGQQLLYHGGGSFVFLVCGIYVLARYFDASNAIFASAVSFLTAAVHLANAIYIYRGDFQRFIESV